MVSRVPLEPVFTPSQGLGFTFAQLKIERKSSMAMRAVPGPRSRSTTTFASFFVFRRTPLANGVEGSLDVFAFERVSVFPAQ